jgi:DNA polymerase III epsilon subunit-like protein
MGARPILTFVDTETTGLLDVNVNSEMTEIAVVNWCDGESTIVMHERVRPKRGMPPETAPYNKSYNEKEWAKVDTFDVHAAEAISEVLKGRYICGSNPDFDKRMIAAECFRVGQPAPKWHHRGVNTCTLGFPLYLIGDVPQTGLEHLAKYFGIEHAAHTALGDCEAAIKVWEAFYEMYLYRPRKMKEALEAIREKSHTEEPYFLSDIALRGLVGE